MVVDRLPPVVCVLADPKLLPLRQGSDRPETIDRQIACEWIEHWNQARAVRQNESANRILGPLAGYCTRINTGHREEGNGSQGLKPGTIFPATLTKT